MDMAKFEPILDTAFAIKIGDNFSIPVPNLVSSYLLFIFIDIMKDAVCMNVLHQIMHRCWYDLHYVHHLPMKVSDEVVVYECWTCVFYGVEGSLVLMFHEYKTGG